jgi:SAM-dependent methyltransferase
LETIARLGAPSWTWRAGQERRLALVRRYVPLEGRSILDIGCGVGMYLRAFQRFTPHVYGLEVDRERALQARAHAPHVLQARGEDLPFRDESFDVVVLNEVLEHVEDDARTIQEACRVLRSGAGHLVLFVPNRLYPFETHGCYWHGRYIFGNIPLLNYLPNALRDRLVPHARAYLRAQLRRLWQGLPLEPVVETVVYPGFDNIAARFPALATILRRVLYTLEATPLRAFGLSHFIVLRKRAAP